MKVFLETIVVQDGKVSRHRFQVAELPAEQFNSAEHWNLIFNWDGSIGRSAPDKKICVSLVQNFVRVWHTAEFTKEERDYLVKEGKLCVYTDPPEKTEVSYEGNK
jgi:hypothetical protein